MDTQIEKHKNIVADSFRKNGYVVVSGVLNKEDINQDSWKYWLKSYRDR